MIAPYELATFPSPLPHHQTLPFLHTYSPTPRSPSLFARLLPWYRLSASDLPEPVSIIRLSLHLPHPVCSSLIYITYYSESVLDFLAELSFISKSVWPRIHNVFILVFITSPRTSSSIVRNTAHGK